MVQKEGFRTMIISYLGIILGFFNRFYFFIIFLSEEEIGLISVLLSTGVLLGNMSLLARASVMRRYFPFFNLMPHRKLSFFGYNLLVTVIGVLLLGGVLFVFQDFFIDFFRKKSPMLETYYPLIFVTSSALAFFYFFEGYLKILYKNVFATMAQEFILRILNFVIILFYGVEWISFNTLVISLSVLQFSTPVLLVAYLYYLGEKPLQIKKIRVSKRVRKIFFSYAAFTYMNSLATMLMLSLDLLMISSLLGLAYAGIYSIVVYMVRVLTIPYTAITRVAIPLVSQHWKDRDMEKMSTLYKNTSSISLIIGMFGFLGVWVSRQDLFGLLSSSGSDFMPGIPVFLFFMIGKAVDMFFSLNGVILVTSKKFKYDSIFNGVLLIVAFSLNLWLIPIYGIMGAAIATSASLILQNLSRTLFVWKSFGLHPFTSHQFRVLLLFIFVFGLFEFVLPQSFGNPLVNMAVKSILVTLLFPGLIYLLKLEPILVDYVRPVMLKLGMAKDRGEE